ncbi:MAG TPA: galactokinase family protein [Anaerolineae bacterium]|nr:galactokinase family protein [Anaerolineae bacterium]
MPRRPSGPPALIAAAPGRICLFGDHADYMGLGVIAAAIDRSISVEAWPATGPLWQVDLPDVGRIETFDPQTPLPYTRPRDYLRAVARVLGRAGYRWPQAFRCRIRGDVPMSAGVSSSSALVIAWTRLMVQAGEQALLNGRPSALDIARWGYEAEVLEFGEPGGMMDQFTSSLGGLVYIDCAPPMRPERLADRLDGFVLGDSLAPKDTMGVLTRARGAAEAGVQALRSLRPDFELRSADPDDLQDALAQLPPAEGAAVLAQLQNWRITREARAGLADGTLAPERLGALLNAHHRWLRDGLGISTPKLERLIDAALAAGALGAKVTGSGGGGCMIAYAPDREAAVAAAISAAGGRGQAIRVQPPSSD